MKNFMPTNLIMNENISIPYKTETTKSHMRKTDHSISLYPLKKLNQ